MAYKTGAAGRAEAARLIMLLLRDRHQFLTAGAYSAASHEQYHRLVSECLWFDTLSDGKYDGCRYWSEGALASEKKHCKVATSKREVGEDALRHEHLFPRKQLVDLLFALNPPADEAVLALVSRLNIAVVVTVREDKRLKKDGDPADPWTRYRDAGIVWSERPIS